MTDNELSREIVDAAIEVHKQLGPGLLESAYEECLAHELQLRNLHVERHKPVPIVYKREKLECGYSIQILVEGRIIVELRSVDVLTPTHEAFLLTCLRLSSYKVGLLINFNVPVLKNGILRFTMSEIKNANAEDAKGAEVAKKAGSGLEKRATHA